LSAPLHAASTPGARPPGRRWLLVLAAVVVVITIAVIVVLASASKSHKSESSLPPQSASPSLPLPTSVEVSSPPNLSVSPSSDAPSPSIAASDPGAGLSRTIEAAYLNYEQVQDHYFMTFDGDDAALSKVATNPLYLRVLDELGKLHGQAEFQKGAGAASAVRVTAIPGSQIATVSACVDISHESVYKVTASTVDPTTHQTTITGSVLVHNVTGPNPIFLTTMLLIDGRWLASDSSLIGNC
jgi:FlaG/FlaF family flagellin (archaellin)